MDTNEIMKRITSLREQKGVSEYKMSADLGHSKSYMQGISSGRGLPSLSEFLYICDYLGVSPKEFFDTELEYPVKMKALVENLKKLSDEQLSTTYIVKYFFILLASKESNTPWISLSLL